MLAERMGDGGVSRRAERGTEVRDDGKVDGAFSACAASRVAGAGMDETTPRAAPAMGQGRPRALCRLVGPLLSVSPSPSSLGQAVPAALEAPPSCGFRPLKGLSGILPVRASLLLPSAHSDPAGACAVSNAGGKLARHLAVLSLAMYLHGLLQTSLERLTIAVCTTSHRTSILACP